MRPPPLRKNAVPYAQLDEARRSVKDAAYRFWVRRHQLGLLPETEFRAHGARLQTGVDPADLR